MPVLTLKAVGVMLLLGLLTGCSEKPRSVSCYLPSDGTVLAVGDSLTRGYGAVGKGYVEQLQQRLQSDPGWPDVRVENRGINGEKSAELLARLPGLLDTLAPQVVLLTSGGNDFLRRVATPTTDANLRQIINIVNQAGALAVLFAVPEPGIGAAAGLMSDHPLFEELAGSTDVVVIEDVVAQTIAAEDLRSDRIHPNAAGYSNMTNAAFEVISQCR